MDETRQNVMRMYVERMKRALDNSTNLVERTQGRDISEMLESFELMAQGVETGRIYDLYVDIRNGMLRRGTYEVTSGDYQTLGEAIKDFRKQSGLTISSLAEITKVSSQTIVCIENNLSKGRRELRKDVRERLMKHFRIMPPEKQEEIYNLPVEIKDE